MWRNRCAFYQEARRYPGLEPASLDLTAIAQCCRLRVVKLTQSFAKLRCGLNWWSFGEFLEVHLAMSEGSLLVEVQSACILPTQIVDWGKNAKNVRRLFEALERLTGAREFERVPRCSRCGYLTAGTSTGVCPECGTAVRPRLDVNPSQRKVQIGVAIVTALTIIELLVLCGVDWLGLLPAYFGAFTSRMIAVLIVVTNVVVFCGLLLLARIWRPNA